MARRHTFRGLWLRHSGRRLGAKGQLFLSILFGIGLAFFLIHRFDATIRPYLIASTQAKLQNEFTLIADHAVAQALAEQGETFNGALWQSEDGDTFTAVTANTLRLNLLRGTILDEIITQVETLDSRSLGVPLGALTGLDILSALGPTLPVQVLSASAAEGAFHSEFTSAGINQTLHRVTLDVTVTVKLLLPGGVAEAQVSTPVCVAETILVGQVPQTYLGWNK